MTDDMLEINAPVGNIFSDQRGMKDRDVERLRVSRLELEKRILRRTTDCGTEIGLNLDSGIRLCNGDILWDDDNGIRIVVEQLPEKVITVRINGKDTIETAVLLGHIIGNMHRPISVNGEEIMFPIQAESERKLFAELLGSVSRHIKMTVENRVFTAHSSAEMHHHHEQR